MTHAQRWERRKRMAAAVSEGKTLQQVARRYRVGCKTVERGCEEQGIAPAGSIRRFSSWALLADLLRGQHNHSELARQHCITRERVGQIAVKARAHGIPIPGPNKRKKP